jgi:hypothetical protein
MVLAPKKAVEKILEEEVNEEQTFALTRVLGNEASVRGVSNVSIVKRCRITIGNGICVTVAPVFDPRRSFPMQNMEF